VRAVALGEMHDVATRRGVNVCLTRYQIVDLDESSPPLDVRVCVASG
jgi:hypothetical protein